MECSKCKRFLGRASDRGKHRAATYRFQGLTTASQKLNRKPILQKYQKEVDKAYAGSN